jgi:antitoxin CptB
VQDGANRVLDAQDINRLKWRCRRGLLENDLFIDRFFRRHEAALTQQQADGLMALMDLSDNDLMDLLLGRKELEAPLQPERAEVLTMLRSR